jgi:hypothetical protein
MQFPIYIRIIEQDMQRGYMMLAGFDSKLNRSSAARIISLTAVSRESLTKMLNEMKLFYVGAILKDATESSIARKLQRMFGEQPTGKLFESE